MVVNSDKFSIHEDSYSHSTSQPICPLLAGEPFKFLWKLFIHMTFIQYPYNIIQYTVQYIMHFIYTVYTIYIEYKINYIIIQYIYDTMYYTGVRGDKVLDPGEYHNKSKGLSREVASGTSTSECEGLLLLQAGNVNRSYTWQNSV